MQISQKLLWKEITIEAFVIHDMEMNGPVFGSSAFAFMDIVPGGKIEEATSGFKFFDRNTIIKHQNLIPLEEIINSERKDESNWKA